jgi:hypothetical protein
MSDPYAAAALKIASETIEAGAVAQQRIRETLMHHSAQSIDFFMGGFLRINGAGYMKVANALKNGTFGIHRLDMDPGEAAFFDAKTGYFGVPRSPSWGLNFYDRVTIVHESTHAQIALAYGFNPIMYDSLNEAAAYIAGAVYQNELNKGPVMEDESMVRAKSSQIAKSIYGRKGAIIPAEDVEQLRAFVALSPRYQRHSVTYYSKNYLPPEKW